MIIQSSLICQCSPFGKCGFLSTSSQVWPRIPHIKIESGFRIRSEVLYFGENLTFNRWNMGQLKDEGLKFCFDGSLRFEFHGSTVTSEAGFLAYRELADALGLFDTISKHPAPDWAIAMLPGIETCFTDCTVGEQSLFSGSDPENPWYSWWEWIIYFRNDRDH